MSRKDHRRAFTLVELLVVIGIIGLLVGILLPTLSKARKSAYGVKCQSNIRQISAAIMMYMQAYKGGGPCCSGGGNAWTVTQPNDSEAAGDWIWWQQQGNPRATQPRKLDDSPVAKYMNARGDKLLDILRCPMDKVEARGNVIAAGPYTFSYTLSDRIGRVLWSDTTPANNRFGQPIKSKVIHNASDKVLIAEEHEANDGRWNVPWQPASNGINPNAANADVLAIRHAPRRDIPSSSGGPGNSAWANTKGGYCGMCDGHVELLSTNEAYDPRHWDPTFK